MDVMTLAAKLTLNTSEYDASLDSSEKKMKGMSSGGIAWGNLISTAVTKAAKAVKDFGEDTVKVGMDFDTAMSQVKALGQLENDDFITLRKKAMDLGASTKFTAAQVAEAFSYMALAGWDAQDMLDGIDGVLNLAAASGEDLGRTSDIITDALTAFGLTTADTAHFVDVLAAASANSNTTVSMMGEAFKYLAANAGVLEYSVDDVAIALGLLANNGIKSTQAGTSLRQIINTLVAPTKQAAGAMEALGMSLFEEGTDKVKPLRQVLSEFRTIFKESDFNLAGETTENIQAQLDEIDEWYDKYSAKIEKKNGKNQVEVDGKWITDKELDEMYEGKIQSVMHFNEEFLANLKAIGGLRGISSLISLMKTTDEDWEKLVNAVDNAEGSAQEMSDTMLDNLEGDITILNSAIEGLKIIVSDSFKDDLRAFVQTLTEEIGNLNEAFQENGFLGMFTNIADWVINGVVDALSNPDDAQVKSFGEGIGKFIGQVAAKLITSLPSLFTGIIDIGKSLAGGLVEGLLQGLFGDNSDVATIMQNLENELGNIEVNSVRAQGLLDYLEELAAAGDKNVTKTDAWKIAVEQLEEIMPGVKELLEEEGATLEENIQKVRNMTDEFRKQAIQQAMVNTLQKQYELLAEQGVNRERQQIDYNIAEKQQKAVADTFRDNILRYNELVASMYDRGMFNDVDGEIGQTIEMLRNGGIGIGNDWYSLEEMSVEQLKGVLDSLVSRVSGMEDQDIWDTDQNYLSPEEIERLNQQYQEAGKDMENAKNKIAEINSEMEATKADIETTEKAVQAVTDELNGTASGVSVAGDSVVSAISGLASRISNTSIGGESDGSNAKGLWDVPYDDYVSTLHRGEMVLSASRAREYREGGVNGSLDLDGLKTAVEAAIKAGMENATVKSFLNGRDITDEVSRRQGNQLKARRYAT